MLLTFQGPWADNNVVSSTLPGTPNTPRYHVLPMSHPDFLLLASPLVEASRLQQCTSNVVHPLVAILLLQ